LDELIVIGAAAVWFARDQAPSALTLIVIV
jgi:hypothetical protein